MPGAGTLPDAVTLPGAEKRLNAPLELSQTLKSSQVLERSSRTLAGTEKLPDFVGTIAFTILLAPRCTVGDTVACWIFVGAFLTLSCRFVGGIGFVGACWRQQWHLVGAVGSLLVLCWRCCGLCRFVGSLFAPFLGALKVLLELC
jgi:hypothetical protein